MLKLLGFGFAVDRRLFGGESEGGGGGGGDDKPSKPAARSEADIQKDINAALKASGGAWTSELNGLVAERDVARGATGTSTVSAASAPSGASAMKTIDTPAGPKTVSTAPAPAPTTVAVKSTAELRAEKEAKDAAATAAAAAAAAAKTTTPAKTTTSVTTSDRDDRAPAGTYVPAAPPPAQVTREPAPYTPLPPAIDYTTTASGRPYEETALRDIYVSGAEAALGPDAGVRYQDLRDTARSYGEDMGVTRAPIETAAPAIDPFADQMQSWFEEAARSPLSSGTTLADLAVSRIPSMTAGGIASLIGAVDPRSVGVTVSPTGQVDAFYRPTTPTAVEQYFRDVAARGREREGQIFSQMSPRLQQEVLAPIFTRQAGYDVGQVDPRLAAAAGLDPDELIFNPRALGTQAILTLPSSIIPLGVSLLNPFAGYGLGAAMTVGEGERSVSDAFDAAYSSGEVQQSPLYQDMLRQTGGDEAAALAAVKNQVMNTATPMLAALGAGSTAIARNVSNIGGIITHALGVPASRTGATLAGAGVEAATEGLEEGFLEQAAIAQPAKGLTGLDIYPSIESMLGEGAVGVLLGGGVGLGSGFVQSTPPFVQAVDPSTSQPAPPFIPAAPGPAPFTPGAGPAATMTVEGTATDVTPGFRPTGPTVGQIAQTPPGLASAYQQAADTMREAGVRNVGGAPAGAGPASTTMDIMAAEDIINNEVSQAGALSPETAQRLANETGLSAQDIEKIALFGFLPDASTTAEIQQRLEGRIYSLTFRLDPIENHLGSMARYLTIIEEKLQQSPESPLYIDEKAKLLRDMAWWERYRSELLEEQARFQNELSILTGQGGLASVDTGSAGAAEISQSETVDTAGIASLPPTDPRLNITPGSLPAAETTPAAEPTTALVPSEPATGVATTTTPGAGTQLDIAQPVDLTATPSETAAIIEFTPTEEFIEGTSVPITGQITGTVATNTTPATTQTTAATTTATSPGTFVFAEEPPEEEDGVMIDVEEEGPAPGGVDEEGVEVELPPETPETDEEEEAPFECPEGYTAVKMAGRWVCQKTETSMVGRPTIGTRPYLSQVGFAGPNPRPQQFTTRTRTITAAE